MSNTAVIIKGSDRPLKIQIVEVDESGIERPVDLSTATEIKACFKNADETDAVFTLTGGKVVREAGAGGIFSVVWEEAETDLLKSGSRQSFEVQYIIGGNTSIVQFEQALTVKERLC